MSVTQGFEAFASEFNTLQTGVNKWFADNYPSVTFGDTNQKYGWGGVDSTAVTDGIEMLASDMNSLIDQCNIGQTIVNNVSGTLSQIVPDVNDILATDYNNIESKSTLINTNKLNIDAGELSLLTGANSVRTITYDVPIDCTFRYTLTDFQESRHFWNSGGAVNISGTITGYTTGSGYDGAGIDEILTSMGTITMNYTETTQSGSGGVTYGIGFYDLTTSYRSIFFQKGIGAYSDAALLIEARRDVTGAYVEILVTLEPELHKDVDGTTTITSQYRKLDNQSSGAKSLIITAPAATVEDELQ